MTPRLSAHKLVFTVSLMQVGNVGFLTSKLHFVVHFADHGMFNAGVWNAFL